MQFGPQKFHPLFPHWPRRRLGTPKPHRPFFPSTYTHTSMTLETRYGRVLFTLIFSLFSFILSFMAWSSWVTRNTSLFIIWDKGEWKQVFSLGSRYPRALKLLRSRLPRGPSHVHSLSS